jgi:adenylate cyclase class 2
MPALNIEFKARAADIDSLERKLLELVPVFIGQDVQVDTYFNVQEGRLKLREGNIENALIWYQRPDTAGAKRSDIILYQHSPHQALKDILIKLHGIKVVVSKRRKIYFIDNVKFHFDRLDGLGTFVEVEAIDTKGEMNTAILQEQCEKYAAFFGIGPGDYIEQSYSDMLLATCYLLPDTCYLLPDTGSTLPPFLRSLYYHGFLSQ